MAWKISTREKKSIGVTETFVKEIDGVTYSVDLEQWWRWGYVIVSDDCSGIDPANPDGLAVDDYCVEDMNYDDGVALWFYYSDNVTDDLKALVEAAWDEDGYSGLEEIGWEHVETETWFHGPLELEDLGGDEKKEEPPTKGTWPF